jgi:hypothetical protein
MNAMPGRPLGGTEDRIRGLRVGPVPQFGAGVKCPEGYRDVTEPGVGYKRCQPMSRSERLDAIPQVGGQFAPQFSAMAGR